MSTLSCDMKLALHRNSFDRFLAKSCTFFSLDEKGGNSEGISPTSYVESWYGHCRPPSGFGDWLDTVQNANSTVEMRDEVG